MIIDTHLHLIDKSVLRYPWLLSAPALDHDFPYSRYAIEARRAGISGVLHMEVDVDDADLERETDYIRKLVAGEDSLIKGAIAACRPESPDFPAVLDRQMRDSLVKGFRRVLHVMPDDLSRGALFRDNIRRLEGTGLTFDLCVLPRQLPRAAELVDLAPGVQFILDHCGVPDIRAGEQHPWRQDIGELARRPNVTAKISGVVAYADADSWVAETLRPYVEHIIAAFGWDRVVWGSDWPVCTLGGGLSTWVATTHALISGATAEEREKLLSANARRIWSLS